MEEQVSYSRQNTKGKSSTPALPKVNCSEVLVICLDLSNEFEKLKLRSRAGDVHTGLSIAKRCIRMFILNKTAISENTRFGLMTLHQQAQWILPPKNYHSVELLLQHLDDLDSAGVCQGQADLSSVFDLLLNQVPPPVITERELLPQQCVRLVLVYGRSHCIPVLPNPESFNLLQCSPLFFMDTLYLHEPADEANSVQQTFDELCDLDEKGLSYVLSAANNMTSAYNHASRLLAHPLQRPLQSEASYKLHLPSPPQQVALVLQEKGAES